jgi:hypothetical protein
VTGVPSPRIRLIWRPTVAFRDLAVLMSTATALPERSARLPARTSRSRTAGAAAVRTRAEVTSMSGSPSSLYGHSTVVEVTGAAAVTPGVACTAAARSSGRPPSAGALMVSCARVPARTSPVVAASMVVWVRV